MKPVQAVTSVALVFAIAIASTVSGMMVSRRYDRVTQLERQISDDNSRIRILRTEVAYLSSPQRIQSLVDIHRPDLKTPSSKQYALVVDDVVPHAQSAPALVAAEAATSSRRVIPRIVPVDLPKMQTLPARTRVAPAPAPAPIHPEHDQGLSRDLIAVVQTAAARDTGGQ